jgi:hypothetical protein
MGRGRTRVRNPKLDRWDAFTFVRACGGKEQIAIQFGSAVEAPVFLRAPGWRCLPALAAIR